MSETASSDLFNWSAPHFIPVEIKVDDDRVVLAAGGESVTLHGELFSLDCEGGLESTWSLDRGDFIVVSLEVQAKDEAYLREVFWFAGRWEEGCEQVVSSSDLQDNVLFLRKGDVSFFISLDFPYSKITPAGISYPPHDFLSAGSTYSPHTISVGASRLSGVRVGDLDRAEIEAVSAYIEKRYPLRFDRPLTVSASITNRMTDVREGRIFYSMHDNPTLFLDPETLEQDIRLMAEVGVEYFQVFEDVFNWPDEEKTGAALRRLTELARSLGVRLGNYVVPEELYCWHYNYKGQSLERPEWRRSLADGRSEHFCLGCHEYLDFLLTNLIEHNRDYNQELICLDGLDIKPCHTLGHAHPTGDVYSQVRGLVKLMECLAQLSPEYLVWTNSGNWLQFMPKLVWFNPNVYLTDPHIRDYAPNLNILKFLGDGRREQMVGVHDRYFVPWRFFTNCEYYAFRRSRINDLRVFEYSFLQGLAVTANICPAEVRTFLDRIPSKNRDACLAFMRKWIYFIRANFDVWKHTARIGAVPGIGASEIYSHIDGDHGFICLINQNPFPQKASFRLDNSIGLAYGDKLLLREIYPKECPLVEGALPYARFGDEINCRIPPHGVRYLQVEAYSHSEGATVYGHPVLIEKSANGYTITLSAPQGENVLIGLVTPQGEGIDQVGARQIPSVPMYTFPVSAQVIDQSGNAAHLEIKFSRGHAPRELTRWRVSPGDVEVELPLMGESAFLGGLVSGAFSEDYEVELEVTTMQTYDEAVLPPLPALDPETGDALPPNKIQTFATEFDLPFIEPPQWGAMMGYDDDTVVELAFSDPLAVKSIAATLNGEVVEVHRYPYPRKPEWFSYYLELTGNTGPGLIQLAIEVEWEHC